MSNKRAALILLGTGMTIGLFTGILVGIILADTTTSRPLHWLDVAALMLCAAMIIYVFKGTPTS